MNVFAIDPGPVLSAYVLLDQNCQIAKCGKVSNHELRALIPMVAALNPIFAIEQIASFGMAVGAEVFETCYESGRLAQCTPNPDAVLRVKRIEVKSHICHSAKANDANIRQALIDRYNGKDAAIGKKAKPGPLYGVSGDMWAALAVGLTVLDRQTMTIGRAA